MATWTSSTYGDFCFSWIYTCWRSQNHFLPPHKWWRNFLWGSLFRKVQKKRKGIFKAKLFYSQIHSIIFQALYFVKGNLLAYAFWNQTAIKVISADTDVFRLLCGMYMRKNWVGAEIYMENFNPDKTVISIRQTVE